MIRRIFEWDDTFSSLCDRDVFGTRTMGYYHTYGTERGEVGFYAQVLDERCVGVLSDAFGSGALTAEPHADFAEWREFVRFLSLQTLLCGKSAANAMGLDDADSGAIMRYAASANVPSAEGISPCDASFSYREVYDLLRLCGFELGQYDAWLSDFALRVRRGAADVLCIRADTTVAAASVLFRSDKAVYLGAVGTHPEYRGRGLAGNLVLRLAQCGKRAEILCKPHRVTFYESLGFRRNGEFTICHFSE